jgi:hypothetical protein
MKILFREIMRKVVVRGHTIRIWFEVIPNGRLPEQEEEVDKWINYFKDFERDRDLSLETTLQFAAEERPFPEIAAYEILDNDGNGIVTYCKW